MFDWSAMLPVLVFLPFFVWIVFQGRRGPLTPAESRRARVVGLIGIVTAAVVGVGLFTALLTPGRAALPARAAVRRPSAPPVAAAPVPAPRVQPR